MARTLWWGGDRLVGVEMLLLLLSSVVGLGFESMVAQVNQGDNGWHAAEPGLDVDSVRARCGSWGRQKAVALESASAPRLKAPGPLPLSFDARTAWPNCTVISHVRDQSLCGTIAPTDSGFSAALTRASKRSGAGPCPQVLAGRSPQRRPPRQPGTNAVRCGRQRASRRAADRCIVTGSDALLSAEDVAGCCNGIACGYSDGCNGGHGSAALRWIVGMFGGVRAHARSHTRTHTSSCTTGRYVEAIYLPLAVPETRHAEPRCTVIAPHCTASLPASPSH